MTTEHERKPPMPETKPNSAEAEALEARVRGYWKKPSLEHHFEGGRHVGHACFGPIQFNWGYTPGLRIYRTWPGRIRSIHLG